MKRTTTKRYSLQSKTLLNRKRRKIIAAVLALISIPCLLISALSYLSYVDIFQFKKIEIIGTQTLSKNALASIAENILAQPHMYVFSKNNIVLYPKDMIASTIQAFSPRIKSVTVGGGLSALHVTVEERSAEAFWCDESNQCMFVDKEGLLYEQATSSIATSTFKLTGYIEDNHVPYFMGAITFVRGLPDIGMHATSLRITPEADGEVQTAEGFIIKIALAQDPNDRLDVLKMLMTDQLLKEKIQTKKLSYIDLRFGNKVYYKPK